MHDTFSLNARGQILRKPSAAYMPSTVINLDRPLVDVTSEDRAAIMALAATDPVRLALERADVVWAGSGGGGGGSTLPTTVGFTTALPLDGNKLMARHFVTGPLTFTLGANPAAGAQLSLELVADGVNTPTFGTGLFKLEGSQDFYNVNGVVNIISLWSDGARAYYAISYNAAATATAPVTPVAPARTTSPTVSGGTAPGATLTRTLGTYTGTPTPTVAGIWQQSTDGGTTWADISGSTGATFGPTVDTRRYRWGNEIGTNSQGSTTPANSNVIVTTNVLAAPVNTVAPSAPATATAGSTVTGTAGTWSGNPAPTFAYVWQQDQEGWVDSAFTTLAAALTPIGVWRLKVTATNSEGSSVAYSNSVTVSEAAAGGTATPISVSSSQNITNEGNEVYAATTTGASNAAHILATGSLTGDGWAEAQRPNDTDSSSYVCLDAASATGLSYSSNDFLAQCNAAGLIQYGTNATTPTSTGYTLPPGVGSRFRVRRAGSQVVLETTVDNGVEWTLRHTYALAPAATLYAHFYTTYSTFARKIYQPRLEGFA